MKRHHRVSLILLALVLLLSACGLLPEEDDRQSSELPEGTAYLQLLAVSESGEEVSVTVYACGGDYEPLSQTRYRFPLDMEAFTGSFCPQNVAGALQAETYSASELPDYYREAEKSGGFSPVCCEYSFGAGGKLTRLDDRYQPALPEPEPTEESTEPEDYPPYVSDYDGSLGSAGALRGTTLIVSIFTDDNATYWEPSTDASRSRCRR